MNKIGSIGELLLDRAGREENRVFMISPNGAAMTYGALARSAQRLASALDERGVRPGDHVVLALGNRPEFLEIWFALSLLGAVTVPIDPMEAGERLRHVIADSDAAWLLAQPDSSACASGLGLSKTIRAVFSIDTRLPGMPSPGVESLRELHDAAPVRSYAPRRREDNVCSILYTSGSTGDPKGVIYSSRQYIEHARTFNELARVTADDTFYTCLPLFHHSAACLTTIGSLIARSRMALSERFGASTFWEEVGATSSTLFHAIGSMLTALLAETPSDREKTHLVRIAISGGLTKERLDEVQTRFGLQVAEVYGMTEIGLAIMNPKSSRRPGSLGVAVPYCEATILRDDGAEAAAMETGELVFREREPGILFSGYYKRPELSAEFRRGGHLHTGDLAYKAGDGFFYFVDRKKDSLQRSGTLSSLAIESKLGRHPTIRGVAVVARPGGDGDDMLVAFVVIRPGASLTAEQFFMFAEQVLPGRAVPDYVEFLEDFPMTPTNKVRKSELRARELSTATARRMRLLDQGRRSGPEPVF